MYICAVGKPPDGCKIFLWFYHGQFTYFYYLLFYLWSLLVLIFFYTLLLYGSFFWRRSYRYVKTFLDSEPLPSPCWMSFNLLYNLDVPCHLNNRHRYCLVWSEKEGLFTPWTWLLTWCKSLIKSKQSFSSSISGLTHSPSVATVVTGVFQKNWFSMRNKIWKITKIFEKVEHLKS